MTEGRAQSRDATPTASLIADTLHRIQRLLSYEVELAKAEVSQGVSRGATGLVLFLVAAVLAIIALNLLAGALVGFLVETGMNAGLATMIVAAIFLLGTAAAAAVAISNFNRATVVPHKAMRAIRRDVAVIKENANV